MPRLAFYRGVRCCWLGSVLGGQVTFNLEVRQPKSAIIARCTIARCLCDTVALTSMETDRKPGCAGPRSSAFYHSKATLDRVLTDIDYWC